MKVVQETKSFDATKTIMDTFFHDERKHADIQFGKVSIAPGERVPVEGLSCHEGNEYSFIVKGSLKGESGGESFQIQAGEATFIPAGEEHWCLNTAQEPCEIVWVLVKE
ncbi:cupin domain-containing protein [Bacillus sp. JJ1532]|uniref:cupin domain-containing protein n=1 Tax=unclassified Bacillus (in: firmicutes) TaxID=185979 RepID=UPI003000A377